MPSGHRVAAVALAFAASALFFVATAAAIPLRDHTALIVVWGLICLGAVVVVARRLGAFYGVPMAIAAGVAFDSFYIPPTRPFGSGDWQNYLIVAGYIGLGILVGAVAESARREAQRSEAERGKLASEQAALRRVATLVAQGVEPRQVFAAAAIEMRDLVGAEDTAIVRFEADATATLVATTAGEPRVAERWELEPPLAVEQVFRTGRTARVDDYGELPADVRERFARLGGLSAAVASPVAVGGRVWGAIVVSSRTGALPAGSEQRLDEFTELLAIAIANADSRAELIASRARIVAAADQARRQVERDLHDGVQQRLVSLTLALKAAERRVPPDRSDLREALAQTAVGLNHATEELREIARGIHPAILTQGGLAPAVRTLGRRSAVPVQVRVDREERLPERVEVAAYYVVAEALANAARHASASQVAVDVTREPGSLRLRVHDDGVGGADPSAGSGLIGLSDRVQALGGTLAVHSPPGEGTTLEVTLPVAG
jgi:signal transduction histidine kinase